MKTSKKRQDSPKCPQCGSNLTTSEADPSGRPMCESRSCSYVGAATKTPAPAVWGPREDAHLAAVEKWLSDEWRDYTEIEAALGDHATYRLAMGAFSSMAFVKGCDILKAELKARRAIKDGRDVVRTGDKVTIRAEDKTSEGDTKKTPSGKDVLRTPHGAFIAAVNSEHCKGEDLIETFRRMARQEWKAIIAKDKKTAWIGRPQAKKAFIEYSSGTPKNDLERRYVDKWAETLKKRFNRAMANAKE